MHSRNANVDLLRFTFMVCIVIFHGYGNLNYRPENFVFRTAFIYVEFFFILTGYYTAKHYLSNKNVLKLSGINSIRYTYEYLLHKFRKMLPCYLSVIVISYVIKAGGITHKDMATVINEIQSFIYNCTFMTSAVPGENMMTLYALPEQLWYLSSMFISLPVICALLASGGAQIVYCNVSLVLFLVYYGRVGFLERGAWPNDIMRGFASMSLGVFLYIVITFWNEKCDSPSKMMRAFLTGIETALYLFTVMLTYLGTHALGLIVFMYTVGLSLTLSGRTYSISIRSHFVNWLGKISFYLFCCHFVVIYFLNKINIGRLVPWWQLLTLYLVLSLGISIFFYFVESIILKRRRKK